MYTVCCKTGLQTRLTGLPGSISAGRNEKLLYNNKLVYNNPWLRTQNQDYIYISSKLTQPRSINN